MGPPAKWVNRVKGLPAWIFHGGKDKVVDVQGSKRIYQLLGGDSVGQSLKLTIFEEASHQCWLHAYRQQGLFKWMLRHRRSQPLSCQRRQLYLLLNHPLLVGKPTMKSLVKKQ